jgi:hypothetical protein
MGFFNQISPTLQQLIPPSQKQPPATKKKGESSKSTPFGSVSWLPSTKTALAAAGTMAGLGTAFYIYQQRTPQPLHTALDTIGTILTVFVPLGLFTGVTGFLYTQTNICKKGEVEEILNPEETELYNKLTNPDISDDELKKLLQKDIPEYLNAVERSPTEYKQKIGAAISASIINRLNTAASKKDENGIFTHDLDEDFFLPIYETFQKLASIDEAKAFEIAKTCDSLVNLNLFEIVDLAENSTLKTAEKPAFLNLCKLILKRSLKQNTTEETQNNNENKLRNEVLIDCLEKAKNNPNVSPNQKIESYYVRDFLEHSNLQVFQKFLEACVLLDKNTCGEFQKTVMDKISGMYILADDKTEPIARFNLALEIFHNNKNYSLALYLLKKFHLYSKLEEHICNAYTKLLESINDKHELDSLYSSVMEYLNRDSENRQKLALAFANSIKKTIQSDDKAFAKDEKSDKQLTFNLDEAFKKLVPTYPDAALEIASTDLGVGILINYIKNIKNKNFFSNNEIFTRLAILRFRDEQLIITKFLTESAQLDQKKYQKFQQAIIETISSLPEDLESILQIFLEAKNYTMAISYLGKFAPSEEQCDKDKEFYSKNYSIVGDAVKNTKVKDKFKNLPEPKPQPPISPTSEPTTTQPNTPKTLTSGQS